MNLFSYTSGVLAFIVYLMQIGRNPDEINNIQKNIGRKVADAIFNDFISKLKRVPRNINELRSFVNGLLEYSVGQKFDQVEIRGGGREVMIICRVKSCKFCLDLESPLPAIFMCSELAGIIERIIERLSTDLGIKSVKCQETRCRARGDAYCEFVIKIS